MRSPRGPESGCRARAQRLDVDGNFLDLVDVTLVSEPLGAGHGGVLI